MCSARVGSNPILVAPFWQTWLENVLLFSSIFSQHLPNSWRGPWQRSEDWMAGKIVRTWAMVTPIKFNISLKSSVQHFFSTSFWQINTKISMLESSVKHKLRISEQGHREDYGVLNKSCNLIGSWSVRNFSHPDGGMSSWSIFVNELSVILNLSPFLYTCIDDSLTPWTLSLFTFRWHEKSP